MQQCHQPFKLRYSNISVFATVLSPFILLFFFLDFFLLFSVCLFCLLSLLLLLSFLSLASILDAQREAIPPTAKCQSTLKRVKPPYPALSLFLSLGSALLEPSTVTGNRVFRSSAHLGPGSPAVGSE
jgi:prepilin signal peptidase PulO-like enzyme (type II secretory pathway)